VEKVHSQWDLVLEQVEFTYDDSMKRSTWKIPFQIIYGKSPKGVVYLVDLPDLGDKRSVDASDFENIMWALHEQVKQKIHEINNKYKKRTDLQRRDKIFK
jgi:hypothetical protein